MCILCVVQRWSRRVAAMLPWLVVPLLVLWILSQLLPPNLRFEITSPRLACVLVLLITLFWYEILMPKLSIWRARRSAMLRERRRTQAIELQKLRRSATRRCRNCLTSYREQNPCGGKFMCSYCGHISKRPVLDLPGWPDWTGECGGPGYGRCLTEKSYSGACQAACSVIFNVGFCIWWVVGKVFRIGQREDGSDGESKGLSGKRGENGIGFQESRGEKAKRKAEEKRQARMEREVLEEEERKQREEVARLVEDQRKLRDEILEAERGRTKGSSNVEIGRKETERRKKERRRGEKDKGSSKSNSDVEEQERRTTSREREKKWEFDRKGEMERQKALVEIVRSQVSEAAHGNKAAIVIKARYFDRVKGTFLSSSKGFNGSFFGRNAQSATAPAVKATKPASGFVDLGRNSVMKPDTHPVGSVMGKSTVNGDPRPAVIDLQPRVPAPKKAWHQLFIRSSVVSPDPDINTTNFVNLNGHVEATSVNDQKVFPYSVDNGFNFGRSFPVSCYSSPNGSSNGRLFSHVGPDSLFSPIKEPAGLEDAELFEDPCYVPDAVSFLGPVSESFDKFPLDLGIGFIQSNSVEGPSVLKNVTAFPEPSKPSPIESPLSKLRVSEEKQNSCTPKTPELHASNFIGSSNAQTWQMWGTGTPSANDGLGWEGGPLGWFSPLVQNKANQDVTHPFAQGPILPPIGKDSQSLPSIRTQKVCGKNQHDGTFNPLGPGLNGNDQWSPVQPPLPVDGESHFLPHDLIDNIARNEATSYSSPNSSSPTYPAEVLPANGWSKEEWALQSMKEAGNSTPVRPPSIGGLFSTSPDVQSVWSYN